MIKRLLIFASVFLCLGNIHAQYYDIGQEPASINWNQIRTKNFRIIFPDYYGTPARETALMLEQWRMPVSNSLKVSPPFTPVILHTASVYSNAYTVWAPRRLEFLTIPPQDIYAQAWNEQLVIHEYRHIAQIAKMNQGFTKFLGYLFGQQAAPAVIGLFVPAWFMEGDAVATETALTQTGRGRVAGFAMPLRAQLKEKGAYHYTKATLGSYRDFVPDEYTLGYHIIATSRAKYGINLWNSALDRVARKPYTLNPFSKGIKNIAGVNRKGLYNQSMHSLDSIWTLSRKLINYSTIPTPPQKTYTTYTSPFLVNDKIIALRKTLSDIHRFVSIDQSGNEEIIYTPGFLFDDQISFNGTYISWAENRPHIRWQTVGYSTIMLLNPKNREAIRLKTTNRLYAPAVSPDNTLIATSEVIQDGTNCLTLIDTTGNIIARHKVPENLFLSSPSWSPNGREIAYIVTGRNGKRIGLYTLNDSTFRYITDYTATEMSHPIHAGDRIIFNMDVNGISEVCRLTPADGKFYILTGTQYGSGYPYLDPEQGNLYFSVYSSDGYRIAKCQPSQFLMQPVDPREVHEWPLATTLGSQEAHLAGNILTSDSLHVAKNHAIYNQVAENHPSDTQITDYQVTDYSKTLNLFNFHSWAPAFIDVEDQSAWPGISVMSQNLLSTMFFTAGYDYNPVENTGRWKADISYRGFYPQINSSFAHGKRADWEGSGDTAYRYTWQETTWDLGISQFLSSFTGRYSYSMLFEIRHQFDNTQHTLSTPHNFVFGTLGALSYHAYLNFYSKTSYRDLAPRTGLSLDIRYKNAIYGDYRAGDLFASQFRAFLPGLAQNHSLQLYAGYQTLSRSSDGYRFAAAIEVPTGYSVSTPNKMIRVRPSYSLPLFYPDWHTGTFFFLKRVRTNLFYDYAINFKDHSKYYSSAGLDLITDLHLFSLPAPITTGIRAAYLNEADDIYVGLIFNLDFTQY